MTDIITPAALAFRHDGTPFSAAFDDIYHSAQGFADQARHVFVAGNGLPARWAGRAAFTIVETGFGLGGNFLVTLAAWLDDPARCTRLHFVSIEKHPVSHADLVRAHAAFAALPSAAEHRALAPLAAALAHAWPIPSAGMQRLEFAGQGTQKAVLTLVFGDAATALSDLRLRADAFYLDGFAPAKNPDMWSAALFKSLARLADVGATCATYTAAGHVRRGLDSVGFVVQRQPGYGPKRDMLTGHFAPRWQVRRHAPPRALPASIERHAMVIGAGLAGCAIVERLCAHGWRVSLLEQAAAPAQQASGNPSAIFHPLLARDDNATAKLSRGGFLYALTRWQALQDAGHRFEWHPDGLLQLVDDAAASAAAAAHLPPALVRAVSRAQAGELAGLACATGGWFFPRGGWLDPAGLCAAQLHAASTYCGAHLQSHFDCTVAQLQQRDGRWHALDAHGATLASADIAILANAHDAARLANSNHMPTDSVRGQLTLLPPCSALRMPVVGAGYLAPSPDGALVAGASYDIGATATALQAASQHENLERAQRMLPTLPTLAELPRLDASDAGSLTGRVGFRCVASDRLPLIGQLADETAAQRNAAALAGAHPLDLPRRTGLYGAFGYGSRGLMWAALGAELLVSLIEGTPLPLEKSLADAIDPARFLLRALRHGRIG